MGVPSLPGGLGSDNAPGTLASPEANLVKNRALSVFSNALCSPRASSMLGFSFALQAERGGAPGSKQLNN